MWHMGKRSRFSRREIVAGAIVTPALAKASGGDAAHSPDTNLATLGQEFDRIARFLDDNDWRDPDYLARLAEVESAILMTQATTMEGLGIKARAACWALLGDIDPMSGETTDRRMA